MERKVFLPNGDLVNDEKDIYKEFAVVSKTFLKSNERPKMFKTISDSWEEITKIVLNKGLENEQVIEADELNNSEVAYRIKDAKNVEIWTKKTGQYFMKSGSNVHINEIYTPASYNFKKDVIDKFIVEKTDKSIKVKKLFTNYSIAMNSAKGEKFNKENYFEEMSFGIEDGVTRYYHRQNVTLKPKSTYIFERNNSNIYMSMPDQVLNQVTEYLVQAHDEKNGTSYNDRLRKTSDDGRVTLGTLISFNRCPEIPNYYKLEFMFCNKDSAFNFPVQSVDEIYNKIANFLNIERDNFFEKYIIEHPDVLNLASIAKSAGIKDVKRFVEFFNNSNWSNIPFIVYNGRLTPMAKRAKAGIVAILKYRTEEEIYKAFSTVNYIPFDFLLAFDKLQKIHVLDGNVFDRFAYNKFNTHALLITSSLIAKKFHEISQKIVDEVKVSDDIVKGVDTYTSHNEDFIKEMMSFCKEDGLHRPNKLRATSVTVLRKDYGEAVCFVMTNGDVLEYKPFGRDSAMLKLLTESEYKKALEKVKEFEKAYQESIKIIEDDLPFISI